MGSSSQIKKYLGNFLQELIHNVFHMNIDTKELREILKLTQEELSVRTGIPRDRIAKWEQGKGSPKGDDTIKLLDLGRELIPNTMHEETIPYYKKRSKQKNSQEIVARFNGGGIPIFDVPIDAGFLERFRDDGPDYEPVGFLNIPKLRNCNFAAIISGNSMWPIMKSGTIAACIMVDNLEYFDEGEMYFVSTANGFETVKYVQSGENPDELKLIPHNEKIKATVIKKSMVLRMCVVEAWLNFR